MAAFYTNMSGTTEIDDALKTLWAGAFRLGFAQNDVVTPFAQRIDIVGSAMNVIKYGSMAVDTSALAEYDEATATALSDSKITLTPAEYGQVVSRTQLANLKTGGQLEMAAFQAVGQAAARKLNKLGTAALEAATNTFAVANTAATLTANTDIVTLTTLNKVYNKLARANVPTVEGGLYVAFLHDDIIHDLRNATGAGSWMDTNKYTNVTPLTNEVGTFGGFRIIRNNDATVTARTGAYGDAYESAFVGAESLLMGVSQDVAPIITGPFDNLGRFVNIGYYGVLDIKIGRPESVWTVMATSTVAANA